MTRMTKSISLKLALIGALAAFAAPAFATVPGVPPSPINGPIPDADTGTGNSGLFLSAWDSVKGVSIVYYLGLTMDQFLKGNTNATPDAGLHLDFGVLPSFSTTFAGSALTDVQWQVSSFDRVADPGNAQVGKRLLTTAGPGYTSQALNTFSSAITNGANFILAVNTACATTNPCVAATVDDGQFAGKAQFGSRYGNQLNAPTSTGLDSSLNFYVLTTTVNTGTTAKATIAQYTNSTGAATWFLSSSGDLVYDVPTTVPLPAAVWLLISGIAGFGAVGRRRSAAAA
jgi:hypothetical protein